MTAQRGRQVVSRSRPAIVAGLSCCTMECSCCCCCRRRCYRVMRPSGVFVQRWATRSLHCASLFAHCLSCYSFSFALSCASPFLSFSYCWHRWWCGRLHSSLPVFCPSVAEVQQNRLRTNCSKPVTAVKRGSVREESVSTGDRSRGKGCFPDPNKTA